MSLLNLIFLIDFYWIRYEQSKEGILPFWFFVVYELVIILFYLQYLSFLLFPITGPLNFRSPWIIIDLSRIIFFALTYLVAYILVMWLFCPFMFRADPEASILAIINADFYSNLGSFILTLFRLVGPGHIIIWLWGFHTMWFNPRHHIRLGFYVTDSIYLLFRVFRDFLDESFLPLYNLNDLQELLQDLSYEGLFELFSFLRGDVILPFIFLRLIILLGSSRYCWLVLLFVISLCLLVYFIS